MLTIRDVPKDQEYPLKLKGMSICFSLLKNALCGAYVNFGVFRLYGDSALDNALSIFIKMLLSVPNTDLLEYPKLSQTYYVLLDCLAQDHMNFLSTLDTQVFLYLLSTISDGLSALDTMVCTACCSALDNIITYLYKQASAKGKNKKRHLSGAVVVDESAVLKLVEMNPAVFQSMLQTVLNILMFEECRNQWSMSRPLLGLILLNESVSPFFQILQKLLETKV
jgi:exportin-7